MYKPLTYTPRLGPVTTTARAGVSDTVGVGVAARAGAVAVAAAAAADVLGALSIPAALVEVDLGEALPAESISGNGVGNRLGVEQEGVEGEVVDRVAGLVVVLVVSDAGLATEERGLLLSLEDLSAREETTRGDAVLDESGVVGAARELGRDGGGVLGLEEVLEVLLDQVRADRAGQVEGIAIAVVDAVDVVGAGNL
jgi:hypothetical protein